MTDAVRRFASDRARFFDLKQTDVLFHLASVPRASRDAEWTESFYPAAWHASLEVGARFQGPDSLPYLRLYLPRPGVAFESNSIGNIVSAVLGRGLGIALFASPEAQEPVYGFSMGVLSSLMEFDSWLGDPVHLEDIARAGPSAKGTRTGLQKVQMPPGHQIFLGAPSNTFFPSYMARALFRHLHEGWRSRSHGLRCLLI